MHASNPARIGPIASVSRPKALNRKPAWLNNQASITSKRGETQFHGSSKKQDTAPKSDRSPVSSCYTIRSLPNREGFVRGKSSHRPPAVTPPDSRWPRLGRAAGALRAWVVCLPCACKGVRRAAVGRAPGVWFLFAHVLGEMFANERVGIHKMLAGFPFAHWITEASPAGQAHDAIPGRPCQPRVRSGR